MSGIVSGVGLFSGLPIQDLIDQLIQAESGPYLRVLDRIEHIQVKRASYGDLGARLLALKNASAQLDQLSFFRRSRALSSHPEVMTAVAADGAVPGSYSFQVQSLVSAHQLISKGFADADQLAVGGGTLAVEIGNGTLAPQTFLEDLNGQDGVGRGVIEIQDRAGNSAQVNLKTALTVDDVLQAINSAAQVNVQARVSGDRIILTDLSGAAGFNLTVNDVSGGTTALDLGLRQSVASDELVGGDINDVSMGTRLSFLNDGNGLRHNNAGADVIFTSAGAVLFEVGFNDTMKHSTHLAQLNDGNGVGLGRLRITASNGQELEVDLGADIDFGDGLGPRSVQTIGDVIDAVNGAAESAGLQVLAQLEPGTQYLQLVDQTTGSATFKAEDLSGTTARDLGLEAAADEGKITSPQLLRMLSLGDVVRAINFAPGNHDPGGGGRVLTAEVSDNGLRLTATDGSAFSVEAADGSSAADDLGLLGSSAGASLTTRPLVAGINTVLLRSLNGGRGVSTAQPLLISNKLGQQLSVDLSGSHTVLDVIEAINQQSQSAAAGLSARLNPAGNGILLLDDTGGGGTLSVSANQTASDLGLGGGATTADRLDSGNLQVQYISEAVRLSTLDHGTGIGLGEFRITTSSGQTFAVSVTENQQTVGEVIEQINNAGNAHGIAARINDTGDGIVVLDSSGGGGVLSVQDVDGQVARKLNLLRDATSADGEQVIDGSYEFRIVIDADDTLNEVAQKINDSGVQISAAVISDGSSQNPFRLAITSQVTGSVGALMFDSSQTGLAFTDLVSPQDAVVLYGGSQTANPIVIRSATNTLSGIVQDVTINLLATSDQPVDLTVGRDQESIAKSLQSVVDSYNAVLERIDELTFFEAETLQSGVLRGESAVRSVESRLRGIVNRQVQTADNRVSRLSDIGITVAAGGRLEFDQDKFSEVFSRSPKAVEQLFTDSRVDTQLGSDGQPILDPETGAPLEEFVGLGLGHRIEDLLDELTRSFDGLLAIRDQALQSQEDLLNDRAETILSLLQSKRLRLESQFAGLEQSLSALSGQQSALNLLALNTPTGLGGL